MASDKLSSFTSAASLAVRWSTPSDGSESVSDVDSLPALDRETFQDFYDRTSTPLRRYLHRVCTDAGQVEDVFQEAYVRLINRRGLRRGPELKSYLFRTATNLLRDHWRRRERERSGLSEFFAVMRDREAAPSAGEAVDLESALSELAPRDRAMLWLAYVEGYAHRDIGEMLGVRPASVRVLLFRLRKRLAERLLPQTKQLEDVEAGGVS
ncbi:MAG: sigma-70 family RNA polymerase sigma factor [Thermoanaerobaculia bacterium]|nr:sigma-70 family RNA polymerase sigma factor [Thermoanaerobaculia bacterium]